jgi:hypothetical protein
LAQSVETRSRDAHYAEDVDVKHAVPFVVVVVLNRALGADAGVVDEYVEAVEMGDRLCHRVANREIVREVGDETFRLASAIWSRSRTATVAPRVASHRAVASPIPEAPPVTMAFV